MHIYISSNDKISRQIVVAIETKNCKSIIHRGARFKIRPHEGSTKNAVRNARINYISVYIPRNFEMRL